MEIEKKKKKAVAAPPPAVRVTPKLTDDLIVEILSRLPVDSFFRSKSVCKSWLAFASDPHYRSKLPQRLAGLFCSSPAIELIFSLAVVHFLRLSPSAADMDADLAFLPPRDDINVLDCCNGLLLCGNRRSIIPPSGYRLYVCNPATRKWVALPGPERHYATLALAYDPCASRDFHVLHIRKRLITEDYEFTIRLEVFSSNTGAWARSSIGWFWGPRFEFRKCSVFLKGMVHLLTCHAGIVAIHPEGQEYHMIEVPESPPKPGISRCIGQSQGFLNYACTESDSEHVIRIWVLTNYNENTWELKHRLVNDAPGNDSSLVSNPYKIVFRRDLIIAFHPEREIIYFLKNDASTLVSYSLITGAVNELGSLNVKLMPVFFPYMPCYADWLGPNDQLDVLKDNAP